MIRRTNRQLDRAILKVLKEKGLITVGGIVNEINAQYRTVKRRLDLLVRYHRKVEIVYYNPNGKLYKLKGLGIVKYK